MGIKHEDVKVSGDVGRASEWNKDHKIDSPVDFDKNEAQSFVIENRTSFPAAPVLGQIIYRTDMLTYYFWNGTAWTALAPRWMIPFQYGDIGSWSCPGCNFDEHETGYSRWKNNGFFTARSNSILAYAPVTGLPDGATLGKLRVNGTGSRYVILYAKNISTGADSVLSSGYTNTDITPGGATTINNSTYAYYIRVSNLDINDYIIAARIYYVWPYGQD